MDTTYERFFERKLTSKEKMPYIAVIVLAVIVSMIGLIALGLTFVLPIAVIAVLIKYFILPKFHVEVEYVLFNQYLEIAHIYNKEKRSTKQELNLEHAELIAPTDSEKMQDVYYDKVLDFSSGLEERKKYSIIISGKQGILNVIIEPDEEMARMMKRWTGSKMMLS